MIRLRLTRRRRVDRELEAAKAATASSRLRAARELRTSETRLQDSQEVAGALARHNNANRYDDWLERRFLGGTP